MRTTTPIEPFFGYGLPFKSVLTGELLASEDQWLEAVAAVTDDNAAEPYFLVKVHVGNDRVLAYALTLNEQNKSGTDAITEMIQRGIAKARAAA